MRIRITEIEADAAELRASRTLSDSLLGILQSAISPVEEPKAEEAPEEEAELPEPAKPLSVEKQIDKGKVRALHNAGWTNAKIAEEMRCSAQRIHQILKEEKS